MADADGATKFADIAKVEAGLQNISPKPVSIIYDGLKLGSNVMYLSKELNVL